MTDRGDGATNRAKLRMIYAVFATLSHVVLFFYATPITHYFPLARCYYYERDFAQETCR